jgi:hypothetical protein
MKPLLALHQCEFETLPTFGTSRSEKAAAIPENFAFRALR